MSNGKTSKWMLVAVAAGAVILLGVETTQAGGFSVSIGGLSIGSWDGGCTRSYVYISDYDDDWGCRYVSRPYYRPYYRVQPYRRPGRFHTMPHHRGHRGHHGHHGHHRP
ncbi:MAG: hypothetical protein JXA11_12480 [Phycisphaerae bacterium]|nr:hypothetical protein [Phycisphaerae bacterium]